MKTLFAVITILLFATSCDLAPEGLTENEITVAFSQIYISKDTEVYTDVVTQKPANGTYDSNYSNGEPKAEITFENGYAIDGSIWDENGNVKLTFAREGDQYTQTRYHPNGNKAQWVAFKNGISGTEEFKTWYEDGVPESESTPEVLRNWYTNGQMESEVEFQDDELHGKASMWHENGELAGECYYVNGELHGKYLEWDENGQLIADKEYENGEVITEAM